MHAGSGTAQAALDLPIQRSVQTGWPIINDSTLRGAWRALAEDLARDAEGNIPEEMKNQIVEWFGAEDTVKPKAGALVTVDAELLLFPVRSIRGITAWVTCRQALEYFARKLELFRSLLSESAQQKLQQLRTALESTPAPGRFEALVTTGSEVAWRSEGQPERRSSQAQQRESLVLEGDSYAVRPERVDVLAQWFAENACPFSSYWVRRLQSHFVLLHEHAFTHYTQRKTDVRTRVKLEHGTVQEGPWTEENLPVDSVLYTVLAEPEGEGELLALYLKHIQVDSRPVLQLGGDQSLGRGFVRLRRLGD